MTTLYERFHGGETLHLEAKNSGMRFYARPEFWERILLGYSLLDEQQKPIPGRTRKQMDQREMRWWLENDVIEIVSQEVK